MEIIDLCVRVHVTLARLGGGGGVADCFGIFCRRAYLVAIFGVQKASLNMFWEHSLYSTIIASDWLRAELSCG